MTSADRIVGNAFVDGSPLTQLAGGHVLGRQLAIHPEGHRGMFTAANARPRDPFLEYHFSRLRTSRDVPVRSVQLSGEDLETRLASAESAYKSNRNVASATPVGACC
jgi:hypothetical protein